jgi:hypothetical protein
MPNDDSLAIRALNLALLSIGQSKTITSLSEATRQGFAGALIYDHEFCATLRAFPWPFATKYLALTLVDGTADEATNDDWQYAYAYPEDCVFARRLVPALKRQYDPEPIEFRVGRLDDALVVYADVADPTLEYTAKFDCPAHLGDELFIAALAWRLAHRLAPALAKDSAMVGTAYRMYVEALEKAAVVASREHQHPLPGESEWVRGR